MAIHFPNMSPMLFASQSRLTHIRARSLADELCQLIEPGLENAKAIDERGLRDGWLCHGRRILTGFASILVLPEGVQVSEPGIRAFQSGSSARTRYATLRLSTESHALDRLSKMFSAADKGSLYWRQNPRTQRPIHNPKRVEECQLLFGKLQQRLAA